MLLLFRNKSVSLVAGAASLVLTPAVAASSARMTVMPVPISSWVSCPILNFSRISRLVEIICGHGH